MSFGRVRYCSTNLVKLKPCPFSRLQYLEMYETVMPRKHVEGYVKVFMPKWYGKKETCHQKPKELYCGNLIPKPKCPICGGD